MKEESQQLKAIISTGLLHILALALCYFFYINTQIPTEEIENGGVVINYGNTDEGMGKDFSNTADPAIGETLNNEPIEDPNRPNSEIQNVNNTSDKEVLTQNTEEAPEVVTKANTSTSNPSLEPNSQPAPPKVTVDSRALFKGKKNNGTGAGDGNGNVPGNQGKAEGTTSSNTYGESGSNGNGGVSLNLSGRSFLSKPKIQDDGQTAGKITVDISVDKNGTIVTAKAGGRGTTISNVSLWNKCEKAVLGSKLNAIVNGPEIQSGSVIFTFILE